MAAALLGACSRDKAVQCASDGNYRQAVTAGTLRVPGDLTIPNEAESLVIPPGNPDRPATESDACLDQSPALTNQPQA